jgi:hypothetical protein
MAAVIAVGLGGPAAAASGASSHERASSGSTDTTPPTVDLDPFAHPKVGSQVVTAYDRHRDFLYWQDSFFLAWTASDDESGVCEQSVVWQGYEQLGGDDDPVLGPNTVSYDVDAAARRFTVPNLNLANHDRVPDRFVVRVTDCAGNVATSNIAESEFGTREDASSDIAYTGHWVTKQSKKLSGGTSHRTSSRGASFTTTFDGSSGPIALVMDKERHGGRADVYVDGVRRGSVNAHGRTRHRVVLWQGLFAAGQHTLKVVNRGTEGHRRIALDTLIMGDDAGA